MKVTQKELTEMVQEAVNAYLKESNPNDPNLTIIASLEPRFDEAVSMINKGLELYFSVMSTLSTSSHPRVKEIGERGLETAKHEHKRWQTIADDLYVAKWHVEYDEDAQRIAQYSDEYENRGTLGEPKV